MKLTLTQRRTLKYYHRLHGTQPTMLFLLAPVWWRYLLAAALAVIAVLILPTAVTCLAAGIVLGIVVCGLMRYRKLARTWPVFKKILDWDTFEALLAENQRP